MFARWLFVRLNAAEKALRQGRIDEAYAAALQPDLRQHPRAEEVFDALVKPLVARARLHRQAGRFNDALADLDKLAAIGRCGPDVQSLRQQVLEEMRANVDRAADRQEAAGRVAEHLQAGRLETGRLDLRRVEDTRQREGLAEELDRRVQRAGQLLQQAGEALERQDELAAARCWQEACQRHGRTRETDAFAARLASACQRALERWVKDGRIDCLMAVRSSIAALLPSAPALAEGERVADLCCRAVAQCAANDYSGLRQTLLRLKAARDDVAWIGAALEALTGIAAGQDKLLASPLGLYASCVEPARGTTERAAPAALAGGLGRSAVVVDPNALRIDRPLLLLVDSGGSALLVHQERVRIGRGGGTGGIDVPIPGDIQSHHADITRRGEDYFLTALGPTQVNRRRVEQTLLRDGDRIVLGGNAKMVFCRPSAKSESAVLRLAHRSRLAQDVSDVILFRDTCLVGPSASCHLRTHDGNGQIVLFERGGALHARQIAGAHWQDVATQAVLAGQCLEFGELRVTVKPYEVQC
jgi:hypothetical protein